MNVSERTCRRKITVTVTHSLTVYKCTLLLTEGIIWLYGSLRMDGIVRHSLLDGELLTETFYVYNPIKYKCLLIVIIYLFSFKL